MTEEILVNSRDAIGKSVYHLPATTGNANEVSPYDLALCQVQSLSYKLKNYNNQTHVEFYPDENVRTKLLAYVFYSLATPKLNVFPEFIDFMVHRIAIPKSLDITLFSAKASVAEIVGANNSQTHVHAASTDLPPLELRDDPSDPYRYEEGGKSLWVGLAGILSLSPLEPYPEESYALRIVEKIDANATTFRAKILKPVNLPVCLERWTLSEQAREKPELDLAASPATATENMAEEKSVESDAIGQSASLLEVEANSGKITAQEIDATSSSQLALGTILSTGLRSNLEYKRIWNKIESQDEGSGQAQKPDVTRWNNLIMLAGLDIASSINDFEVVDNLSFSDTTPANMVAAQQNSSKLYLPVYLVRLGLADKVEFEEYLNVIYRQGNILHNFFDYNWAFCFGSNRIGLQSATTSAPAPKASTGKAKGKAQSHQNPQPHAEDSGANPANPLNTQQTSNPTSPTLPHAAKSLFPNDLTLAPEEIEVEQQCYQKLLTAIRLFGPGYVGLGPYFKFGERSVRYNFQDTPAYTEQYPKFRLAENQVSDFVEWVSWYYKEVQVDLDSAVGRALSRFDRIYTEQNLHERITDTVIGLETLLKPGKSGEISYSVAQRAALLSVPVVSNPADIAKRLSVQKIIKKAYDVRSSLVHTNSRSEKGVNEELAAQCQEILRKCIKTILRTPLGIRKEFCLVGGKNTDNFYETLILAGDFEAAVNFWGTTL